LYFHENPLVEQRLNLPERKFYFGNFYNLFWLFGQDQLKFKLGLISRDADKLSPKTSGSNTRSAGFISCLK